MPQPTRRRSSYVGDIVLSQGSEIAGMMKIWNDEQTHFVKAALQIPHRRTLFWPYW